MSGTHHSPKQLMKCGLIAAALLLAVPAGASADAWDAEDAVERKLVNMGYAKYDPWVYCSRDGYRRYWCNVHGFRGDCFLKGHASVRQLGGYRFRITTHGVGRSCF